MDPLFDIRNVCLSRTREGGDRDGQFVLSLPRLIIPQGKTVAIIGRSASGKSTFLNLLGGIELPDPPSPGEDRYLKLYIDGKCHNLLAGSAQFPWHRVGRVFQSGHLLPNVTVALNIAAPLVAMGGKIDRRCLLETCKFVRLPIDLLDRRAWELSGGEKQRVALARAIIHKPSLVYADEPSSSLDPDLGLFLMERLDEWRNSGEEPRSVLWVTHNYEQAHKIANNFILLDNGCLSMLDNDFPGTIPDKMTKIETCSLHRLVANTSNIGDNFAGSNDNGLRSSLAPLTSHAAFAIKVALCELLSRPSLATRGFANLSCWTSIGVKSNRFATRWRYAMLSFNEWGLVSKQYVVVLLAMIILLGGDILDNYCQSLIQDPRNRHMVITGSINGKWAMTVQCLSYWKMSPWLNGIQENCSKESEPNLNWRNVEFSLPVFPRMTKSLNVFARSDEGKYYSRNGIILEVLIASRKEPFFEKELMSNPQGSVDRTIYLNRYGLKKIKSLLPKDDGKPTIVNLRVDGHYSPINVGKVEVELPTDSSYAYDAFLPLETYNQLSEKEYAIERAAFYFDAPEINKLVKWLGDQQLNAGGEFRFELDNLIRVQSFFHAGLTVRAGMIVIMVLIVLLFVKMIASESLTYVQRQRIPLIVNRTLGMTLWMPLFWLCSQVVLTGLVSSLFVLVSLIPIVYAVNSGIQWWLPQIPDFANGDFLTKAFYIWLATMFFLVLFSVVSTAVVIGKWWHTSKDEMGRILQSGGS